MAAFDSAAQDAAALGVTICAASGDNGSSDGVNDGANHVDFPASSPHILACGGTSLLSANGAIKSETVWNDGAQGGAGGGGFSNQFPLPAWQASANIKPPSGGGRGVPDVRVGERTAGGSGAPAPCRWSMSLERVADDKAMYAFVPTMIRYYLGEEQVIGDVGTWVLADPHQYAGVRDVPYELGQTGDSIRRQG